MSKPPGTEAREPLCDFCEKRRALIHCRADDATLCLSCDRHVHAANTVSSRHTRSLLCDVCAAAPSTILCSTHRYVLCHNCDFDAHNRDIEGVGVTHERRPVEPYSGCPTASEFLGVLGIGYDDEKCLGLDDDDSGELGENRDWYAEDNGGSLLLWEAPPVMSLDDLIVPTRTTQRYQAVGVPPPPKDRNISCGKHKDEIIQQLRGMMEAEPNPLDQFPNHEECISLQDIVVHTELKLGDKENDALWESATVVEPFYEEDFQSFNHLDYQDMTAGLAFSSTDLAERPQHQNYLLSHDAVSNSQSQQNLDDGSEVDPEHLHTATSVSPGVIHALSVAERDSAISRYREKRKTRRYDKHVRYESRKARAETRIRIKGRFARVSNRDAKQ